MLLTSAADSTVMHNKFANFADYNVPNLSSIVNPPNPSIVSRNLEVNLGEVSSTTDILPSPPAKSEREGYLGCSQHLPHEATISVKSDPERHPYSSASVLHSPAFFNPQTLSESMHFYHTPTGSCATNAHYPPPSQYNNSRGYTMYPGTPANAAHQFSGTLSSLISQQGTDIHSNNYSQLPASNVHAQHRDSMSADLAAAGAVAAAAARARVVGGVEEEVMNQQRASRRQMHKICEQKRRDGLKTAMETLKMTIPGCSILSDQSQQNILLKGETFNIQS